MFSEGLGVLREFLTPELCLCLSRILELTMLCYASRLHKESMSSSRTQAPSPSSGVRHVRVTALYVSDLWSPRETGAPQLLPLNAF